VERDIGQAKRRWKVIREDDGFVEAEGDKEVRPFLANLWGSPGPERLSELFHGLIGVKQGRFTQPFDSSPSMARGHFDPLLDVDIFRRCFDYLLEPVRLLNEEKHELEKALSGIDGQLMTLSDLPEKISRAEATLRQVQDEAERVAGETASAQAAFAELEKAYKAKNEAEQLFVQAEQQWREADGQRVIGQNEVRESENALEALRRNNSGYQAYRQAEQARKEVERKRIIRDQLLHQSHLLSSKRGELVQEKQGKEGSLAEYQRFDQEICGKLQERTDELNRRQLAYAELETAAAQIMEQTQRGRSVLEKVRGWHQRLSVSQTNIEQEIQQMKVGNREIAAIDPNGWVTAEQEWEMAKKEVEEARVALAKAEQEQVQLKTQLQSIEGGICPFLQEACHQFDPKLIQDELATVATKIQQMKGRLLESEGSLKKSEALRNDQRKLEKEYGTKKQLVEKAKANITRLWLTIRDEQAWRCVESLERHWPAERLQTPIQSERLNEADIDWDLAFHELISFVGGLGSNLSLWQEKVETLDRQSQELAQRRGEAEAAVKGEIAEIARLTDDVQKFKALAEQSVERIRAIEMELGEIDRNLEENREALEAYDHIDQELAENQSVIELNRQAFAEYIRYEPIAQQLIERQSRLQTCTEREEAERVSKEAAEKNRAECRDAYHEDKHTEAREHLQELLQAQGQIETICQQSRQELEEQLERKRQFEALSLRREEALSSLDEILGRMLVLDKTRSVLKNTQTLVAQGLTHRIQQRAQTIFNAMSTEPVRFEWDAGEYKLTIHTMSGARRFAQLSGGQQMKVAIAMQLALVKEFSSAGFCAFDEPTYGLDGESRALLADAILRAQEECRFEQLFVVSHDEAFDDKVEHMVSLEYSAKQGSQPA
ncbi:MAG TPA: hypothetical protein VHR47_13450, partial [Bacillota bacterium]|nr:hypothetical protein [Bacillota bacterium]